MTGNFGQAAALYARVRPGYLSQVFDDIVALASLPDGGRILEIGPGTGQATLPLAQRGYSIVGIEPDAALTEEARSQLNDMEDVQLHVSTFEAWPLPKYRFDLVLAATSWHWLDSAVRYTKAAAALKPGGALAIINTHHVAGGTRAFFDAVQACYRAQMPSDAPVRRLREASELEPDLAGLVQSGLFEVPMVRGYDWQADYTAPQYLNLLSTYSDHIALTDTSRQILFRCIEALIDGRFGGKIVKQYLTELIVAKTSSAGAEGGTRTHTGC